jgi:Immunoglobulin-like domain of bacterial spore germination
MMKAITLRRRTSTSLVVRSLLFLLLLLSACGAGGNSTPAGSSTPTSGTRSATPSMTTTGTANPGATPVNVPSPGSDALTPSPGVHLGVQPCPAGLKDPTAWVSILQLAQGEHVENVSCANLIGDPSLQALVTVRSEGTAGLLSVYVYNNLANPSPTRLFQLEHLDQGDARISGYNTILTGEVDTSSSVNKNAQGNAALVQDLFREFTWSSSAATFTPIAFPGLFPDLTRFQAEADQTQVNQGHQPWKLNAILTAQAMAATLLKWNPNAPATLVKGGEASDVKAVVQVQKTSAGSDSIKVTMYRLESNTSNGIWMVTEVETAGADITVPDDQTSISPPVTVQGKGNAFEGKIGMVAVLDHTYTDIGHADVMGATGNGQTTFSTTVPYTSTATQGTVSGSPTEEGIVALYTYSSTDGSIATVVMVKVLLHA